MTVAHALGTSRRGVSLKHLAAKHEWQLRTLYRDIEALEQAGFPIVHEAQRYRLMDGFLGPHAALERDELLALFLARQLASGWRPTALGRALERLWQKLTSGSGHGALLPDVAPWLTVRPPLGIDYTAHQQTIATLELALRERVAVSCRYLALSTATLTARVIEPAQLHWDPALETLYLIAYCRLRADVRVFAVHRFRLVALTGEHVARRPGLTSRAALRSAFRIWRGAQLARVRVRFSSGRAPEIRERQWHPSQRLEDCPDGGVILTLEVAGLAEVERWVLGFGGDAQVLEPRALVTRVRAQLERATALYERPPGGRGRRRKFDLG